MRGKAGWLIGGLVVLGLLPVLRPAQAEGVGDFKLTRAIPADAMIAVHTRNHEGLEFVNEQYQRIWAAIEKQGFDRDLRRVLRSAIKDEGGDVEEFEERWQQITDLAAGVGWSGLAEREFAFAMKVAPPFDVGFLYLMMPAEDEVAADFEGLTAILKNLVELAPEGQLVLSTEGSGESVVHTLGLTTAVVPLKLTLARHEDVLLLGVGTGMAEQSLALLRGEVDAAGATLASTDRFRQAFKRLPPPGDELHFVDIGKLMNQLRAFAEMGAASSAMPTTAPSEGAPAPAPLAFLPKIVDVLDIWDYAAGVSKTEGMKTTAEEITVLRADAESRPLYRVLHGSGPVRNPLKFIPKEATNVSIISGLDFQALYRETLKFIRTEVPDGEALVAKFEGMQAEIGFDFEEAVLSWIGGSCASFGAPIPTPFLPGWVWIVEVRDEEKANEALTQLCGWLDAMLVEQNGGVEDAKLPDAEGFKRVILPPMFAMVPGLGRPVFGVKEGHLFIGNGPEIVTAALKTGAGEGESFARNERFMEEGLALGENVVAFSFKDLSKLGQELGQMLPLLALGIRMAAQDAAKEPMVAAGLNLLTKVGNVCKELDFLQSSCSVTTLAGNVRHTRSVVNYQESSKRRPKKPAEPTGSEQEVPEAEE